MTAINKKSDEELIEIISRNIKYSPDYLRGMTSNIPLEELAAISKTERRKLYVICMPIFFAVTATPFGLLILGKLKPKNTTFKFLGFGLLGINLGKVATYNSLYTEAVKSFPQGTIAEMGRGRFLTNILFRGKNIYGEGWVEPNNSESEQL